jgi:hypothetical protein
MCLECVCGGVSSGNVCMKCCDVFSELGTVSGPITASAHRFFRRPVASIMARAPSTCICLARSAALLDDGES